MNWILDLEEEMFVCNLHLKMMSCTEYVLGSALKSRKTVENLSYKVPILMNLTQLQRGNEQAYLRAKGL